jgi:ubiquinone/menaquinone biosynthesis C-methylase UbiE/DNA-binding transcriptional ArsR family regulator
MAADNVDRLMAGLRAAAEPTRLRILALCQAGDLSVSDLVQILGQSQPRVSRHLKLMADAGLLERFREGTFAFFRLAEEGVGAELARQLIGLVPANDAVIALDRDRLDAVKRQRAEAAAAYFDRNAADWDRLRALHIGDADVERAVMERLPAGAIGDLVDLGTGTGRMLTLAGARARRAIGIDQSREMLAMARANLEKAGLVQHCQVRQGDLYQLPLPGDSFDVAIIHHVLHYLEEPGAALAETARVLRPGGQLLIVDFAPHDLEQLRRDHAHRWLGFPDAQIAGWLRHAGFEGAAPTRLPGVPLTVSIWPATRLPVYHAVAA